MFKWCRECKYYVIDFVGYKGGEHGYCTKKCERVMPARKACKKYFEAKNDSKRNI